MRAQRHAGVGVLGSLLLAVVSACDCRSDVERANAVFEAAEQIQSAHAPARPAEPRPGDGGDPCPGSPGTLVAVTREPPSALAVYDGTAYWDDEHLYWVQREDLLESAGRLMHMPKRGGAPALVREAVRSTWLLVERDVLIAQADTESRLHRITPDDGQAAPIVDEPIYVSRPVLDRGTLFWSTAPARYAEAGCIRSRPIR